MIEQDPSGLQPHEPGAKLDAGKPRMGLVLSGFADALEAVARVGTMGAAKYTPEGWRFVPDGFNRYTDAMLRHYFKESKELNDPESNLAHAAHLCWNSLARLQILIESQPPELLQEASSSPRPQD